ncbi:hypothetical protein HOK51_08025 [Candidatus Woesearchaeota archaeon]|jgi:hypothetical protein|nr:hypothetical protein [Candidatus Woesearchaeota archaeon]MBT6519773.1 hypothetical protein [Candidatus Woesearchaeota archaeon]MBT7368152.1 hypothetical protein [Candidatus Woesearchaeota archaeon]
MEKKEIKKMSEEEIDRMEKLDDMIEGLREKYGKTWPRHERSYHRELSEFYKLKSRYILETEGEEALDSKMCCTGCIMQGTTGFEHIGEIGEYEGKYVPKRITARTTKYVKWKSGEGCSCEDVSFLKIYLKS